jgi:phage terminase large subunit
VSRTSSTAVLRQAVRQAEAVLARHRAVAAAPRVAWAGIAEEPERFARRLRRTAATHSGLLLAVVPHAYPLPSGVRRVELPAKCFRLLHPTRPKRYRVLRGGRGAAKSWSIARVLIVTALARKVRVLCAREIQKSIRDSVHRLLADQIDALGLFQYFDVGAQSITGHNGSEFLFEGLWANVNKIKSLEGIDLCWVEEAARVSAYSWEILIPTVRKPKSEFLINFNPEGETDPTYVRFVTSPPPDAEVINVTWQDNPWFPEELEKERQYLERVDPDAALHVWNGQCRTQSDAQVFRNKYAIEPFEPQAGWDGPYMGADWGFSHDPTTLVKAWIHERTLYIEHEAYAIGCDIDRTPLLFDLVPGAREHIVRADSARPETISYMQRKGYPRIQSVEKWPQSVEEGVLFLRQFERIVVHPRCEHVAQEMRLYSYKVDRLTGDVLADVIDKHNHTIDAIRYALQPLIRRSKGGFAVLDYTLELAGRIAAENKAAAEATAKESSLKVYEMAGGRITSLTTTGWKP